MKKLFALVLAVLAICSSVLVCFAAEQFAIIASTSSAADRTGILATLHTWEDADLTITAQLYRYSSVADDYMRSVKFEVSEADAHGLSLSEDYSLNRNDKVVFTFTADWETTTETIYVS